MRIPLQPPTQSAGFAILPHEFTLSHLRKGGASLKRRKLCVGLLTSLALLMLLPAASFAKEITIKWWINPWRIAPPGFPEDKAPTGEDFPKWISEQFMKLYPNVKVEYEVVTNAGFDQKVAAAILSGNPPDLLRIGGFNQKWVKQRLLEPINNYLTPFDKQDFYNYALDLGRVDNNYYMFPWNNSNNGMGSSLLLNPAIFKERGVAMPALPDRKWTLDQFMAAARKLSYDTNGDGTNEMYAIGMAAKMDPPNNLAWLHMFGARYFDKDETKVTLNSAQGVRGLQWMVDAVYKEKISPPGAEGMGMYDVINLFHAKKLAIGYGGPYEIGRIDRYVKEGKISEAFPVHIAQFPHLPEIGPVAYHTSGGFVVFRQRDEEKKKMVMELAHFITNPENTKMLKSLLYVTARKSVNEKIYEGFKFEKEIDVYLRAIDNGIPYFGSAEIDTTPIDKHLTAVFEAAFARTKTPKQTLDDFAAEANRILFKK